MNHNHIPPCVQHPGDWCDPNRRAFTRRQCLSACPNLVQCSQSALRNAPSYGMWAGVWINGDFRAKKGLLVSRAQAAAEPGDCEPVPPPATPPPPRLMPARRIRVGKLLTAAPPAAVAAQITARASGNCEIMAPACTYGQGAIFSRRRRAAQVPLTSPADALAACPNCIDLIEHTDIPTALDLGYLVDPRACTSATAVLWRQHRWVYLDTRGRIRDTAAPAAAQTAS